jgi:gluconokinase
VNDAADASASGAAFIGMKAIGLLDDLKNVGKFLHEVKTFEPDMSIHSIYKKYFKVYKGLYGKLKGVFEELAN